MATGSSSAAMGRPDLGATIEVIDSGTEELFFTVAEAQGPRHGPGRRRRRAAFDEGPWPRMTHAQRAEDLRALGPGLAARRTTSARSGPARPGVLHEGRSRRGGWSAGTFDLYAGLADTFDWEETARPAARGSASWCGSRWAWSAPSSPGTSRSGYQLQDRSALLAGCTVILKSSPEAPGEGYLLAEVAEEIGLPPGRDQCGHRRPRGFGAAGPGCPRRQDHLHRVDRRRAADRLPVRRADRPLHPRARREVGRGHPRRRRSR